MRYLSSKWTLGVSTSLALLAVACTKSDETPPSNLLQAPVEGMKEFPLDPKPAAQVSLPNGNTLEFHDFGDDIMVLESGKAGNNPFLNETRTPESLAKLGATPAERLSGIWKAVAPGQPMPQSLKDIQARSKNLPDLSISRERPVPITEIFGESLDRLPSTSLPKAAAPVGCNNGCCDYQWLATFSDCKKIWDYNWFNYNYGWSKVNSTGIDIFSGTVCAAVGNSIWKVNISDGKGGSWTIQPGYYKSYWWIAGLFDKNSTSSVNTSTSQALHTYCGNVSY